MIQETSDIIISQQQIVDALDPEEKIPQVKQEVEDEIRTVPTPDGLGYRAVGDTYEAFITVDGTDNDTSINVLSSNDVKEGVTDLLADILLNEE